MNFNRDLYFIHCFQWFKYVSWFVNSAQDIIMLHIWIWITPCTSYFSCTNNFGGNDLDIKTFAFIENCFLSSFHFLWNPHYGAWCSPVINNNILDSVLDVGYSNVSFQVTLLTCYACVSWWPAIFIWSLPNDWSLIFGSIYDWLPFDLFLMFSVITGNNFVLASLF